MKREHKIRPDFVVDNINDINNDLRSEATFASNDQTLSGVNASNFANGQTMTLVDTKGNSQVFIVSTSVSTQDGSKDGSGRVIIGTSDVGSIESDSVDLAQKLVAVINASRSNGDHDILATTPAADSARIALVQPVAQNSDGNISITSNIHGYTSFVFSGGTKRFVATPLRMVIPGLSSLRTNPTRN